MNIRVHLATSPSSIFSSEVGSLQWVLLVFLPENSISNVEHIPKHLFTFGWAYIDDINKLV